ncbi:hypothetical protein [Ruminococcus champanellensis]|uniref:hypothetical protein n=1 Tax=Ruminococcus champanellensis TaxID=1161942 RepID=UPI0026DCFF79|nr:hypothetical protein [Ruminococcus champanellensis]
MIYYTGFGIENRQTAGAKAPSDILHFCKQRHYQFIGVKRPPKKLPRPLQLVWKYCFSMKYWNNVLHTLEKGDTFIYQHPLYVSRTLPKFIDKLKAKGIKLIVLIHDLETLRMGIEGAVNVNETANNMIEGTMLKNFDVVICHNQKMKAYLIGQGYTPEQLVDLQIFDYITDCKFVHSDVKSASPTIAIAGNLLKTKCGYIYHIHDKGHNPGLVVNLYGMNFDSDAKDSNLVYNGSFPAAELPEKLDCDFGLVWDGISAETCAGHVGEYLKYNNPHKTSLYLSSGIPVIVWNQAAIADFVTKNKVGITVGSLYDAEAAIQAVSAEEYKQMCANARKLAERLRTGYFFYKALDSGLHEKNQLDCESDV